MLTPTSQVDLVNGNMLMAQKYGLIQQFVENISGHGKHIQINGHELVNYSSCSYLGLETDVRLKDAAIDVINKFGVHFSSSRSYLSLAPYLEVEELMAKIFGKPVIVTPSTTLGHLTVIPILISPDDYVIVDQQVHASVQFSLQMANVDQRNIERIRHNRMDYLDNRINKLRHSYKKIWYLADGIYSMFGDVAPMADLHALLNKYDEFRLYIDDAHGMSWMGERGRGYVLSEFGYHQNMVLLTSLGKGFGTSGGAIICFDEKQKDVFLNCGGPMIFSGPLQPANLGAALACSKIHLTDEIYTRQSALNELIDFFTTNTAKLDLPIIGRDRTPIFYIGLGKQEVSCSLCAKLRANGFHTSIAGFPSVPFRKSGVRVQINLHHTKKDIEKLLDALSFLLPETLREENFSLEEIHEEFKIGLPVF